MKSELILTDHIFSAFSFSYLLFFVHMLSSLVTLSLNALHVCIRFLPRVGTEQAELVL